MKTIGDKIKELRRSKGMSQKELADSLGITSQAVSKWENNNGLPEMTMLPEIAAFFGIQIDDLLEYSVEKPRYTDPFEAMAQCAFLIGKKDQAISYYKKELELLKDDQDFTYGSDVDKIKEKILELS